MMISFSTPAAGRRRRLRRRGCSALVVLVGMATLGVTNGGDGESGEPFTGTTLEAYLERALAANPGLEAGRWRYEAARAQVPQEASLPDPRVQLTYFIEPIQTRTGPQEGRLSVSQRFPWAGKRSRGKDAAALEAEALALAYESERLQLERSVAVSFFENGYIGKAIELTRENRDWLATLEAVIEERVKAGGDLNPLLRLKVEIGRVDDSLQSFRQQRLVVSARLNELLALPADTMLLPPSWEAPEVAMPDAVALAEAVVAANPELDALGHEIEAVEARERLARLESYPDITAGLDWVLIGEPDVNPTTPDAGRDAWSVTVGLNVPLWAKRNESVRTETTARRSMLVSERRNRANELLAALHASLAKLDDANRRLRLYGEELLGLAEQAVENSRTSYEGGRTGILEVIDSERSLLELQLLYWRAAVDAWQQHATIQTLANRPVLTPSGANERDGRDER